MLRAKSLKSRHRARGLIGAPESPQPHDKPARRRCSDYEGQACCSAQSCDVRIGRYRRITPTITTTKNNSTMPWTTELGTSARSAGRFRND